MAENYRNGLQLLGKVCEEIGIFDNSKTQIICFNPGLSNYRNGMQLLGKVCEEIGIFDEDLEKLKSLMEH